jgi:hypothetical protein
MPSITWQVKPPQYVGQPAGALAGSSGETPALGEFWYREGGAPGSRCGARHKTFRRWLHRLTARASEILAGQSANWPLALIQPPIDRRAAGRNNELQFSTACRCTPIRNANP